MRKTLYLWLVFFSASLAHSADITVSAASSLSNAFKDIGQLFEATYPEHQVHFNFAGSGILLQQILHGAPVDVYAPADQLRMDQAEAAGLIALDSRRNFTSNQLVLIAPKERQFEQTDLTLLLQENGVERIAVSNPDYVPVGHYTQATLQALNLWQSMHSRLITTQNVRQTLDYVSRAEVDLGFVYLSDARLKTDSVEVLMHLETPQTIHYPIAVLGNSSALEAATAFIATVLSAKGQAILQAYGFGSL